MEIHRKSQKYQWLWMFTPQLHPSSQQFWFVNKISQSKQNLCELPAFSCRKLFVSNMKDSKKWFLRLGWKKKWKKTVMTKYLCQIQRPFWLIKNIKNENKILEEDLNVKNPFKCQSCDFKSQIILHISLMCVCT